MDKGELRRGFTTGACAAAAAKAAAAMLFTGSEKRDTTAVTYKGTRRRLKLYGVLRTPCSVRCGVRKYAGDDPDITDGAMVYATVLYIERDWRDIPQSWYCSQDYPGLFLTGGEGVGIVTRPGLSCPVGKPAINPVPREMIWKAVWGQGASLLGGRPVLTVIEIQGGASLAGRTFNPKLGIQGGLSVLGTTGVVEPMSEQALVDTIRLEIHMRAAEGGKAVILTPGSYGETFLRETLRLSVDQAVKCSNFIGEAVDIMRGEGLSLGLLAGHVGKLSKVAGGARNTHSKYGDGRMEALWQCAEECVLSAGVWKARILSSNTADQALSYLDEAGVRDQVCRRMAEKIKSRISEWSGGVVVMETVIFSLKYGILGKTGGADKLIRYFSHSEENI